MVLTRLFGNSGLSALTSSSRRNICSLGSRRKARIGLVEPARAPDLAPQRERLLDSILTTNHASVRQPYATAPANLPISSLTIWAASIMAKWPAFGTTFAWDFGTLAAIASIHGVVMPGCSDTRLSSLLM